MAIMLAASCAPAPTTPTTTMMRRVVDHADLPPPVKPREVVPVIPWILTFPEQGPYAEPGRYSEQVERWRWLVQIWFHPDDVRWAMRVMNCESRGNPEAKNRGSTALGLFQFLRGTWGWVGVSKLGLDPYPIGPVDPWQNVQAASWLYYNRGPEHWVCK